VQTPDTESSTTIELATNIVAAFVAKNSLPMGELPALIGAVHSVLANLENGSGSSASAEETKPEPAVLIRKSITPDYLVCLDDGKKFKSLGRHLRALGMTPNEYRAKWGLPSTYPMVAANYSAKRSELAKNMGLGQKHVEAATRKRLKKAIA
jgi:predicted transcriptional regulator